MRALSSIAAIIFAIAPLGLAQAEPGSETARSEPSGLIALASGVEGGLADTTSSPQSVAVDPLVHLATARLSQRRYADAVPALRTLADRDNIWAIRQLARLNIHGQGMPRDTNAAMTLLQHAATLGDAESALALGVAYQRTGLGAQARLWLAQALTSRSEHIRIDARRTLSLLD